jgi:hypothetical protein
MSSLFSLYHPWFSPGALDGPLAARLLSTLFASALSIHSGDEQARLTFIRG